MRHGRVATMNELRELLSEFGLKLSGYEPGVSAFNGNCLLDFGYVEWTWLKPLLVELAKHRKRERETGERGRQLTALVTAAKKVPEPTDEGFCEACCDRLPIDKYTMPNGFPAYRWRHKYGCWFGDLRAVLNQIEQIKET